MLRHMYWTEFENPTDKKVGAGGLAMATYWDVATLAFRTCRLEDNRHDKIARRAERHPRAWVHGDHFRCVCSSRSINV